MLLLWGQEKEESMVGSVYSSRLFAWLVGCLGIVRLGHPSMQDIHTLSLIHI